jgi:hypothetical protein
LRRWAAVAAASQVDQPADTATAIGATWSARI